MDASRSSSVVLMLLVMVVLMTTMASASKITVGGNKGWSPNVNYIVWAQDKHFYYDDWLFFVYDRNQQNVLEVNETNYESCNEDQPLHNFTTGAGRDVVHLNVTRRYYFISGKGFCYSGMKLAIQVEKMPPPPPPTTNDAQALLWTFKSWLVLLVAFAAAALWNAPGSLQQGCYFS